MENRLTEAEKSFHNSRIMWAEVDGELYWTKSELGHKEWLKEKFCLTEKEFEEIKRGYIRKSEDTVNVVIYKGNNFEPTRLSDKVEEKLNWLVQLMFTDSNLKINWYNGVEVGKTGEVWKPLHEYVFYKDKYTLNKNIEISLYDLLVYEKGLTNIINKGLTSSEMLKGLVKEKESVLYYIENYFKLSINSGSSKVAYRVALYHSTWL